MGDIIEYLKAYWTHALSAYKSGRSRVGNLLAIAAGALAVIGLKDYVPAPPEWAVTSWVVIYVTVSLLIVCPYQMWKAQRDEIRRIKLLDPPGPDWRIDELFFHIRPDLRDEVSKAIYEPVGWMCLIDFQPGNSRAGVARRMAAIIHWFRLGRSTGVRPSGITFSSTPAVRTSFTSRQAML